MSYDYGNLSKVNAGSESPIRACCGAELQQARPLSIANYGYPFLMNESRRWRDGMLPPHLHFRLLDQAALLARDESGAGREAARGEAGRANALRMLRQGLVDGREVLLRLCLGIGIRRAGERRQIQVGGLAQHGQGVVGPGGQGHRGADGFALQQAQRAVDIALADALVDVEDVLELGALDRFGGAIGLLHRVLGRPLDGRPLRGVEAVPDGLVDVHP